MFSVYCPTHGTEVLLPDSHITAIESTATGHLLHWRCFDGTEGTTVVDRVAGLAAGRFRPAV